MSAAITGSSSMISTSVASSASISRLRLGDQLLDLGEVGVEDLRRLAGREALERGEQKGLARARRDAHQPRGRVVAGRVAASSARASSWAPVEHQMVWKT